MIHKYSCKEKLDAGHLQGLKCHKDKMKAIVFKNSPLHCNCLGDHVRCPWFHVKVGETFVWRILQYYTNFLPNFFLWLSFISVNHLLFLACQIVTWKKKENYIWFQRPRLWGIIVSCFWQIFTWVWLNIHTPLFWIQIKGFKCSLLNKQLNFINYLCSSIISVKENHQFKWKRIFKVNKPPLFSDTILVAIASGKKIITRIKLQMKESCLFGNKYSAVVY